MKHAQVTVGGELILPPGRMEDAFGQPIRGVNGERLYIGAAAGAEEVLMNRESYQYWGAGPAALTFVFRDGAFVQELPRIASANPRWRWFGWFR